MAALESGLCSMEGKGTLCTDSGEPVAASQEGASLPPWAAETFTYMEGAGSRMVLVN